MNPESFINAAAIYIAAAHPDSYVDCNSVELGEQLHEFASELCEGWNNGDGEKGQSDKNVSLSQSDKPHFIERDGRRGVFIPIINKAFFFDEIKPDMKWDEAMEYCKSIGKSMPTLKECYIWQYFKEELEALFKDAGREYPSRLWSCSQYSASNAWLVGDYGNVNYFNKYYGFTVVPLADLNTNN